MKDSVQESNRKPLRDPVDLHELQPAKQGSYEVTGNVNITISKHTVTDLSEPTRAYYEA
jgi:hypothetical protein